MGIANRENNPRKNSEGYSDPTAFEALRNIDKISQTASYIILYL